MKAVLSPDRGSAPDPWELAFEHIVTAARQAVAHSPSILRGLSMPIPFTCPNCGSRTLVDDCYAGLTGPCATCAKLIEIPDKSRPVVTRPASGLWLIVLAGTTGMLVLALFLFVLVFPTIQRAQERSGRVGCGTQLAQIVTALRQYEVRYGSLPPAYTVDASGQPMHSWRVLILPYLPGGQAVYQEYDMSQPWNSAWNRRLATRMPGTFCCPRDSDVTADQDQTSFMVIVGDLTAFPPLGKCRRTNEITDGTDETLLVVEVRHSDVSWMAPIDIVIDRVQDIGSNHASGVHVATADGEVRIIPPDAKREAVQAAATIDSGELIPGDTMIREPVERRY